MNTSTTLRRRSDIAIVGIFALTAGFVVTACETTTADHDLVASLTNHARATAGLRPLQTNLHLSIGADRRARAFRDAWVAAGCTGEVSANNPVDWYQPSQAFKQWKLIRETLTITSVIADNRYDAIHRAVRHAEAKPDSGNNILNSNISWMGQGVVYGPTPAQSAAGACLGISTNSVMWVVQAFVG